jgi:hypothetical protein
MPAGNDAPAHSRTLEESMKRLARPVALLVPLALAAAAFASGGSAAAAVNATCKPFKATGPAAGKPVTLVTNKATATKPATITVDTGPGLGFSGTNGADDDQGATTHAYTNVQVVSKKKSAALYVRAEFPYPEDYDLFLRYKDGTGHVAYAAGFNEFPGTPIDGTSSGHSEMGAEQIDGVPSKSCLGYTVDLVSATTPGGKVTIKYWLK